MTTASDPAPTRQMEGLLQCSLCQEILKEPRTLGCFHSFCKHCLARYVEIQRGGQPAGRVKNAFQCPLCRTQFKLRQCESVERLPSNHFINNLLEILVLQQQGQKFPCDSCKAQLPAVHRCVECEKYLCKNCLTAHSNWPDFKDHEVLTLEELAKPENQAKARGKPRCKKQGHGNKYFEFYCNTCQKLACINCVVLDHPKPDDEHQAVHVVAAERKEALNNTSASIQEKSELGQNALKRIECASQVIKESAKVAKDAILRQEREILKQLTVKLKCQTAALIAEVDQKYNNANEKLVQQQRELNDYVEKVNGSLRYAQSIIEKGSDEEIVSLGGDIEKKLKQIETECPKKMNPVANSYFEYQAKSTKSILDTVNLNDLGEIVDGPDEVQLLFLTSAILEGDIHHAKQLARWLKDSKFGWKLCYRASQDGWSSSDFHRKCDEVGPTVTLIKSLTNVFGGYTDQSWKPPPPEEFYASYKPSSASFLFSLRNKDNLPPFKCPIYDHKNDKAICCNYWYGALFGDGRDLCISDKANANQDSFSNLSDTYQPPPGYQPGTPQTRSLLAGSFQFSPTEIEVFHR